MASSLKHNREETNSDNQPYRKRLRKRTNKVFYKYDLINDDDYFKAVEKHEAELELKDKLEEQAHLACATSIGEEDGVNNNEDEVDEEEYFLDNFFQCTGCFKYIEIDSKKCTYCGNIFKYCKDGYLIEDGFIARNYDDEEEEHLSICSEAEIEYSD